MNLFRKSYKIILLFLWLQWLYYPSLQGITESSAPNWYPEILTYNIPAQYNSSPTTSFCRTSNGTTIIGKKNGILTIDNRRIFFVNFDLPVFIHYVNDDSITYQTVVETGMISFDASGKPVITSIKHSFQLSQNNSRFHSNVSSKSTHSVSDSFFLYDKLYLQYDKKRGLSITDENTSEIKCLIPSAVLDLNDIQTVFVDHFQDIWICDEFSVYKIDFPSSTCFLDLSSSIKGNILSTEALEDDLYISSTEGLVKIKDKKSKQPEIEFLIEDGSNPLTNLSVMGNQIVALSATGLHSINNSDIINVDSGIFHFLEVLNDRTLICQKENRMIRYTTGEASWDSQLLDEIQGDILSEILFESYCWLLTDQSHIYRIGESSFKEIKISIKSIPEDYRLVRFHNDLFLLASYDALVWDRKAGMFVPVKPPDLPIRNADISIYHTGETYWYSVAHENEAYTIGNLTSPEILPSYDITADKKLGALIDIDETVSGIWISGRNKLLHHRKTSLDKEIFPLSIQSVVFSPTHAESNNVLLKEGDKVKFRHHSMIFSLRSPRYLSPTNIHFRYRITNYQEDWSDWSKNNTIVLSNLFEKKYTFEAQALSPFGAISDIASFSFTITPPTYRTWSAYVIYGILILITSFLIYKARLLNLKRGESRVEQKVRERMASVMREKEKSDKLVNDLFPKGTIEEFKKSGRTKTRKFEMVTVLFSDIQGFTRIAEEMNPEVLIDELDKFFFRFDSVVEKYNIEKIKTIGDAYMAAGGIPVKNSSNPVEVVLAGLEMQYYMKDLIKKKSNIWDLRIGIHTGPVIAGVVGQKKLSYDIWGDTVNTASRMESSGESGKVNISGTTYGLIKDYFICEYRGKLPVKYKGNIDMYFVTGLRPELSVNLEGIPNKRFFIKLQLLRLKDLEKRLYNEILSENSLNLQLHNPDHIHGVINQVELLCRSENIPEEELLLVQSAAILLFTGLSESITNFENTSSEIARRMLPEYSYKTRQIEQICNMILASRAPFQPQNKLEEILIDARMEFIGRPDYPTCVKRLFLEYKSMDVNVTLESVVENQIKLLQEFRFYTLAAQRLREVDPDTQITNLKTLIH